MMTDQIQADIETCPECGARSVNGMNCWEQLGLLLAWEYDDPELQAEHFLTVAAYNLQHPAQFTDEALDYAQPLSTVLIRALLLKPYVSGWHGSMMASSACSRMKQSANPSFADGR